MKNSIHNSYGLTVLHVLPFYVSPRLPQFPRFPRLPLLILLSCLFPPLSLAQSPPVSFSYDPDGNMTARYVVRAPSDPDPKKSSTGDNGENSDDPEQYVLSVVDGEQKISIYPNPTNGNITLGIAILDGQQKNFLRLYDAAGRLLLTEQIQQNMTPVEIKGPPGIYLLDIHLGERVSKWKIIKE